MIECPNCNAKIDELIEICPNCKINLDKFEEENKTSEDLINEKNSKTILLRSINIIQFFGLIIGAIICWGNEEVLQGFIDIVIGLVIFAFIKGFSDIIDLLNSINNKLS